MTLTTESNKNGATIRVDLSRYEVQVTVECLLLRTV